MCKYLVGVDSNAGNLPNWSEGIALIVVDWIVGRPHLTSSMQFKSSLAPALPLQCNKLQLSKSRVKFWGGHGMEWNERRFFHIPYWQFSYIPFLIHTKNFLFHIPFHTKFSCMFHSILSYQGKFWPEATCNLYCTLKTLSVLLQVIAHEGKQYGTMHLIPYLKHHRNDIP